MYELKQKPCISQCIERDLVEELYLHDFILSFVNRHFRIQKSEQKMKVDEEAAHTPC